MKTDARSPNQENHMSRSKRTLLAVGATAVIGIVAARRRRVSPMQPLKHNASS